MPHDQIEDGWKNPAVMEDDDWFPLVFHRREAAIRDGPWDYVSVAEFQSEFCIGASPRGIARAFGVNPNSLDLESGDRRGVDVAIAGANVICSLNSRYVRRPVGSQKGVLMAKKQSDASRPKRMLVN